MNFLSVETPSDNDEQSAKLRVITLAYNSDERKAKDLLQHEFEVNPEANILQYVDNRGYTLLHICGLNTLNELASKVIDILKYKVSDGSLIKEFVNKQTDEGIAALHFAAFRGNIKLIKMLEECGADFTTLNPQGLNAIHIASQGDQPVCIAYFLQKGLKIEDCDYKGSTALHWACFLGCENSVNFLTVWGADPNLPDYEGGLTPLHLAVISGNIKVVRKLLIKGANRNIKSKENKTAIDIAKDNGYENIMNLLKRKDFFIECCNIRPGLGNRRSKSSLISFMILYFLPHIADVVFILPCNIIPLFFNVIVICPVVSALWQVAVFGGLFFLTALLFFLAWLADPGFLSKNNLATMLILLENYDCTSICPECALIKPPRSRHCELCKRCVQVFDHHCPWIDNCIGAKNYGYFYLFIFTLLLNLAFLIAFSILNLYNEDPTFVYFIQLFEDKHLFLLIKDSCCIMTGGISLIFLFPISVLVFVQTRNLFSDTTTSERYGHNRKNIEPTESLRTSARKPSEQEVDYYKALPEKLHKPEVKIRSSLFSNCLNVCFRNASNEYYK